jgi:hypothetical protein
MSINAINGASPDSSQTDQPPAVTPAPAVTPFSQQLDAEDTQTGAAQGHHHHHHHGSASQSVTTSATAAASVAGTAPKGAVQSSVLNMLS